MVPSPCQQIYGLDPASGLCIGCSRSAAEIAAWIDLDKDAKQAIIDDLPHRAAVMKSARVAAARARRARSPRRGARTC